jgi:hypothetical protein
MLKGIGAAARRHVPRIHTPHASHTAAPLSLQNKPFSLSYSAANLWIGALRKGCTQQA